MFEDQTFEVILERMLDKIPEDVDKREGAIIYDALAPAAIEITECYMKMSVMYDLIFGITSDKELLEGRAADFNVEKKKATSAIYRGIFTDATGQLMDVPFGTRYTAEGITFKVIGRIAIGEFLLESETLGAIANQALGNMIPVEYIEGLGRVELTELLVPGVDEQSAESLKAALDEKVSKTAASGNEAEYEVWAKEVAGVHSAKVHEQWNGPNTVKVVLMDNEGRSPSQIVIQQTWEHIKSVRPVGAIVTVVGVTERVIGVTAKLTLQEEVEPEITKLSINENITKYLKSIAGVEKIVRYTAIGNAVLDGTGVIDYANLTLDGSSTNIILGVDEVPVLGTLTLT